MNQISNIENFVNDCSTSLHVSSLNAVWHSTYLLGEMIRNPIVFQAAESRISAMSLLCDMHLQKEDLRCSPSCSNAHHMEPETHYENIDPGNDSLWRNGVSAPSSELVSSTTESDMTRTERYITPARVVLCLKTLLEGQMFQHSGNASLGRLALS